MEIQPKAKKKQLPENQIRKKRIVYMSDLDFEKVEDAMKIMQQNSFSEYGKMILLQTSKSILTANPADILHQIGQYTQELKSINNLLDQSLEAVPGDLNSSILDTLEKVNQTHSSLIKTIKKLYITVE